MNFFKRSAFLLILCVNSLMAIAQSAYKISGTVKDKDAEPLMGAAVKLKTPKDSVIMGTLIDLDGGFAFEQVLPGTYKITVSFLGFEDYTQNITIDQSDVMLNNIALTESKSNMLKEVKIVETAPPVQQKEDTTQYNANSYKVNPDASAEDLVRKMPGIDLSGGKVQAQGEDVKKVLVDGKPFFGEDATSSLRNLPAEIVEKIQVYDERSEQSQFTGFDDGNTSKTINIITKSDKKEGVFGRVYSGAGTDGTDNADNFKYTVGGNVNYFKNDRRISLLGQSNNINIQNFSSQDLLGISGSSGGRGFGRGGAGMRSGSNNNFNVGQQNGINQTTAAGINYSDKWGKKVEVTGSYFFNNTQNTTTEKVERQYVLPSMADQTYNENSFSTTNNYNHRFNLRLNYTIDSSNSILFVPNLSFQNNNSFSDQNANTIRNFSEVLNNSSNTYNSSLNGYNMSSMLLYRHKFKKQGRTISLWANGGLNNNQGNTSLYAPVSTTDTNYVLDQISDYVRDGWNLNTNLTYTEPITKKSGLQVQYGINYQTSESDKRTYNYNAVDMNYSDLDSLLSNTFSTDYLTHKGGIGYRYNDAKFNFNIGLDAQSATLNSDRILPYPSTISRPFTNVLPNARLQYNFTKKKNLRLFYRTSTNAPSVDQLQDVVNNSNPLQQSAGNPNLVQSYQHNLNSRYSSSNTNNGSTFFIMFGGALTQYYIGRSTIIADQTTTLPNGITLDPGQQFSTQENMSGYYNVRSFSTYGMPLKALKSNINVNANASYARTPGLINSLKNYANNTNLGLGLVLSSNISEKIDFTLSSNGNYNIVKNTLSTSSDSRFYNQSSRFNVNYIFWKGIVFNTELNHQLFTGLSQGFNQNFLLWNMSLAKKVFKKQQGEIKLSVFDLLGQNTSITPLPTEAYTQYTQTNVLQRYFLLTFTYNLRFFKGGASMKDIEKKDEGNMHFMPGMMPPHPGGGMPPGR